MSDLLGISARFVHFQLVPTLGYCAMETPADDLCDITYLANSVTFQLRLLNQRAYFTVYIETCDIAYW